MLRQEFSQGKEAGVLTFRCKFVPSDRIRNRIRMFKAFASIVKQFKPDLVHAHVATEAGRYAAIWCSYYKIPFIVTEHATVEISGGHMAWRMHMANILTGKVKEMSAYLRICKRNFT